MSDLSDRITRELLSRYRIRWLDESGPRKVWKDEDFASLSATVEHILGPEPWRDVLSFRPAEIPTLAMVKSKAMTLRKASEGDRPATARINRAFDDALKEMGDIA